MQVSSKSGHRDRLLTRPELAEYLSANNYPTSLGTLNRLCAPSVGAGPPPEGCWAGKAFYDPARALAWARRRFGEMELRRNRQKANA
jgi:hypothetical protein